MICSYLPTKMLKQSKNSSIFDNVVKDLLLNDGVAILDLNSLSSTSTIVGQEQQEEEEEFKNDSNNINVNNNNNNGGGVDIPKLVSQSFQIAHLALDYASSYTDANTCYTKNNTAERLSSQNHEEQQEQQQPIPKTAPTTLPASAVSGTSTHTSTVLVPMIDENVSSSDATGYHSAGVTKSSLSRYNQHREGFVFSNGQLFDLPYLPIPASSTTTTSTMMPLSFQESMNQMFQIMYHHIAMNVLSSIHRHLQLETSSSTPTTANSTTHGDFSNWFEQTYGPMETSSQWHIKRFVTPSNGDNNDPYYNHGNEGDSSTHPYEWLPVHTDPSLISIIIHDRPGVNPKAMGLQYQTYTSMQCTITTSTSSNQKINYDDNNKNNNDYNSSDIQQPKDNHTKKLQTKTIKIWKDVPLHGHSIAIIFVGSLLSYITGGYFPSAKHRVIYNPQEMQQQEEEKEIGGEAEQQYSTRQYRQAATLFIRPQKSSILTIPPSELLKQRLEPTSNDTTTNGTSSHDHRVKIKANYKFQDWIQRVSANYMKHKMN